MKRIISVVASIAFSLPALSAAAQPGGPSRSAAVAEQRGSPGDVDVPGNLTMVDSTSATGNVLKNGVPFIHNFGFGNTFLGSGAGNLSMGGTANTATGFSALTNNDAGDDNTAAGDSALRSNSSGSRNTAIGAFALTTSNGFDNTAVGFLALGTNTTGLDNTAVGNQAMRSNTMGDLNTALGGGALYSNLTGFRNTAVGLSALEASTAGNGNTALGSLALSHSTGHGNIGIGVQAGTDLQDGDLNVYIANPGPASPGIESNTIRIGEAPFHRRMFLAGDVGIGTAATPLGRLEVVGNGASAVIGDPSCGPGSNTIAIGFLTGAGLDCSNNFNLGASTPRRETVVNRPTGGPISFREGNGPDQMTIRSGGNVGIGTATPSFKLDVAGPAHATSFPTSSDERLKKDVRRLSGTLEKLEQIRGVNFEWNERYEAMGRSTGKREIGVIAQEVEAVFPELVSTWGPEGYRAVDYGRMTGVLIEAIKEQQSQIRQLKAEIEDLRENLAVRRD